MTEVERTWLSNARAYGGGFVKAFAEAMLRADEHNLTILRPAFAALRAKYPDYGRSENTQ